MLVCAEVTDNVCDYVTLCTLILSHIIDLSTLDFQIVVDCSIHIYANLVTHHAIRAEYKRAVLEAVGQLRHVQAVNYEVMKTRYLEFL